MRAADSDQPALDPLVRFLRRRVLSLLSRRAVPVGVPSDATSAPNATNDATCKQRSSTRSMALTRLYMVGLPPVTDKCGVM